MEKTLKIQSRFNMIVQINQLYIAKFTVEQCLKHVYFTWFEVKRLHRTRTTFAFSVVYSSALCLTDRLKWCSKYNVTEVARWKEASYETYENESTRGGRDVLT